MSRPTWDRTFLDIAEIVARRSTCPKRHVGAVIVNSAIQIISIGYNGSAPGEDHCDEVGCIIGPNGECLRTIHAENNALLYAGYSANGGTLYLTLSPCARCANLILRAGITRVVFSEYWESWHKHGKEDPLEILRRGQIKVVQFPLPTDLTGVTK